MFCVCREAISREHRGHSEEEPHKQRQHCQNKRVNIYVKTDKLRKKLRKKSILTINIYSYYDIELYTIIVDL